MPDHSKPKDWMPDLSLKALKPLTYYFVQVGWENCQTPAMREAIRNCFNRNGLFSKAITAEQVDRVRMLIAARRGAERALVVVPDDIEVDAEELEIRDNLAHLDLADLSTVEQNVSDSDDDDSQDDVPSLVVSNRAILRPGLALTFH